MNVAKLMDETGLIHINSQSPITILHLQFHRNIHIVVNAGGPLGDSLVYHSVLKAGLSEKVAQGPVQSDLES